MGLEGFSSQCPSGTACNHTPQESEAGTLSSRPARSTQQAILRILTSSCSETSAASGLPIFQMIQKINFNFNLIFFFKKKQKTEVREPDSGGAHL